jgi:hypothetical protein
MGQNLRGEDELEIWPTLLEHWMELHGWMANSSAAVEPERVGPKPVKSSEKIEEFRSR